MQQNGYFPNTANAITRYFNKASLPTQQQTLGQIDQRQMRQRLREVAKREAALIKLLGVQPKVVGVVQQFLKLNARLIDKICPRQALDVPEGAWRKIALLPLQ